MSPLAVGQKLFVPGLLEGRAIALSGAPAALAQSLAELGARVETVGELDGMEEAVGDWARAHTPLDALVYVAGAPFGAGGNGALLDTMQEAWTAVREVAVGALLEASGPGKVVLVGPSADAGPQAAAAGAALENLARTLSVEWARYNVTAVMVAPGAGHSEPELTQLTCFLCSAAGDYFSGCRIDLSASVAR
jgi:NAD(P)-dependent dehydrogenase (short-subunit alcohol dehydrogenase family)